MLLKDAIGIKGIQMISLVGAGGKTSIIFRLAQELASNKKKVLISTTTKMYIPDALHGGKLVIGNHIDSIIGESQQIERGVVTWAGGKTTDGKITGILPEYLDAIYTQKLFDIILLEADGSKQKSLKAPSEYEPVIPKKTSIVLGVMGIDTLGKHLDERNVHRPELIEKITGNPIGSIIDADLMAKIALHKEGLFKNSDIIARKILVLNKVDDEALASAAVILAELIKERTCQILQKPSERAFVSKYVQIEKIISTSLKKTPPVVGLLDNHDI
jgi:probable selenium-dependent hydroxylase accessory protein YqeC